MRYKSTRNSQLRLEASQVIAQGISEEGGLFVPETLPDLREELPALAKLEYPALAKTIFRKFLTDFTPEEVGYCVDSAYMADKFDGASPVKLVPLLEHDEDKYLLELWHGPTCAFKDMALQILPYFLTTSLKKSGGGKEAVILTATSGDTGKAALEGFKDVPGTRILVFYPRDGVSPTQKKQMVTQEGGNVCVCAIEGNFDDAQASVKRIFTDPALKEALAAHGLLFSSANSINWGRLLPQIVYYVYAYLELARTGRLSLGDPMDVVVPTGNFGNILAAYYARKMGIPIRKLVCASNRNKVLTDFIRTGTYDRRRPLLKTTSPSMDILVSSNLERLLYLLSQDTALVASLMEQLNREGVYTVPEGLLAAIQDQFWAGCCDDSRAEALMGQIWRDHGYLCDPHTAAGWAAALDYTAQTGDTRPMVVLSTASPYKFPAAVLSALGLDASGDGFDQMDRLQAATGIPIPRNLASLRGKPELHTAVIDKEQMLPYVLSLD